MPLQSTNAATCDLDRVLCGETVVVRRQPHRRARRQPAGCSLAPSGIGL